MGWNFQGGRNWMKWEKDFAVLSNISQEKKNNRGRNQNLRKNRRKALQNSVSQQSLNYWLTSGKQSAYCWSFNHVYDVWRKTIYNFAPTRSICKVKKAIFFNICSQIGILWAQNITVYQATLHAPTSWWGYVTIHSFVPCATPTLIQNFCDLLYNTIRT